MSNKIDERVVAMKFNSGEFKKGVSDTTDALEQLKDALDMDGLTNGVETIASKFNLFGAIGFAAIQKLTGAAMEMGQQLAGAILDPLVEGGKKRALNIEQARFQFKGLGMDVEQSMADALYAVKGTAFGLDEAAVAAAQFGASGVKSGAEMQAALLGISGVAAMSGSSYTDMANVFTKVAGQGRLMGDDLNRLGSRGINAAATLGKALGKSEQDIRAMVTKGKIDFKTFTKVMSEAFGEHATKASDTYTGSLSNMNAALARIGASFATVDFETQRKQFNAITPAIDNIAAALVPVISLYTDLANASADKFVSFFAALNTVTTPDQLPPFFQGLKNILEAVTAVIRPITEAFAEIFPPTSADTIISVATAFEAFTRKLIPGEAAIANIKMIATGFFAVLKFGVDIVMGIAKVVGFLIGFFFNLVGAIFSVISPILTFVRSLLPVKEGAEDATSSVTKFFDMLVTVGKFLTGWLIDAIRNLGTMLDDFLNSGGAVKRIQAFKKGLSDLAGAFAMVWNVLTKGDFTKNAFFSEDSKFVDVLFRIREAILNVVDAFKEFFSAVGRAADRAGSFWSGVGAVLKSVWGFIQPIAGAVGRFFKDIMNGLDLDAILAGVNAGVLVSLAVGLGKIIKSFIGAASTVGTIKESFIGVLDELGAAFGRFQEETAADKLIKIAAAVIILAGALWIISTIDPERLLSSATAMAATFAILLGALKVLDKFDIEPSIKASIAITLIAAAVLILAAAVKVLASLSWDELARGLVGLVVSLGALVGAIYLLNKVDPGKMVALSFALTLVAGAVVILAGAIMLLSLLSWEDLIKGMLGVVIGLGAMVGALLLLSTVASDPRGMAGLAVAAGAIAVVAGSILAMAVAMLVVAGALNLMVLAVENFGRMDPEVLSKGLSGIGGALLTLAGGLTAMVLALPGALALVVASIGLLALAGAIKVFSLLSPETVAQGLDSIGSTLLVLAGGLTAMLLALPGALALVVAAFGLTALAGAIALFGAISPEIVNNALGSIAKALLLIAVAGVALLPAIPGIMGLAVALGIVALAAVGFGIALVVISAGLAILGLVAPLAALGIRVLADAFNYAFSAAGPIAVLGAALLAFGLGAVVAAAGALLLGLALLVLATGLIAVGASAAIGTFGMAKLAETAGENVKYAGDLALLGASLLAFGAGAVVAGAGALILGIGLLALGAGLALVSEVGAKGASAMQKVAEKISEMLVHIPGMLAMGGAFVVLGGGAAALGGGLLLLGAGAMLTVTALMMLVPLGLLVKFSIDLIIQALERLAPMSGGVAEISSSLGKLGTAVTKVASNGKAAASGLMAMAMQFTNLAMGAQVAGLAVQMMAMGVAPSMAIMISSVKQGPIAFQQFAQAVILSMSVLNSGLTAGSTKAQATVRRTGSVVGVLLVASIVSSYGSVYSASRGLGDQMIAGMNRGLQNGSYRVASMAAQVARTALNSAKNELGVASPSKEFEKVGAWSDDGLVNGLMKGMGAVDRAGTEVGKTALSALQKSLADLKNAVATDIDFVPTIKPVFDLSEVRKGSAQMNAYLSTPTLRVEDSYAMASSVSAQRRANEEAANAVDNGPTDNGGSGDTYIQNNYSPKAISAAEQYRNTKNLISIKKGETPT